MTTAFAQLDITISGGIVRGIPIAIVPFKNIDNTELLTQIDQVVTSDLAASGKFEPINHENFLSFPSRTEEVRFKDWRFADAEALVVGEVWKLGDDLYEVQFHIYDVAREQEIGFGKRIPNLRAKDLRHAAHIISDQVYQAFTGRGGAFNSRIAYVRRQQVDFQNYRYSLMVADWDGFGGREVYASWKPLLSPAWSPNGRKLSFVGFGKRGSVVQILDLKSGDIEVVAAFNGVNSAPAWSPDGTKLAYSSSRNGSPDVYIYNTTTRQHQRISTHYGIDTEPAWSSDGQTLLYTSSRSGRPQIYRHNLTTQSTVRQTFDGKENANGSFDPRDQRMVMVQDGGQIVVMHVESGDITSLVGSKFDESPSFSPNGDMVLYASEQNFEPALMVASSDGRIRTRLKFVIGDVREPAWSPLK